VKRRFQLELCCVLVRPFGAARQTLQRSAAGLTYRALAEPEALAWCSDPELELNASQVQAAFARGDVCLGAFDGTRLVGYGWLAYEPAPHTGGAWVHFDPEGRYSYKKFVRPGDRGRRVAHGLSALADAPVFVRGRRFTISFVDLLNRASLRSTLRSGSRKVGFAGIVRLGRHALALASPGARRYGFRFAPSSARAAPPARPFSRASSRG
jgi:hypothetical protein